MQDQINEMLRDRNTYKPITDKRRNPTSRIETELQKKLLELKKQESMTESEYWKLRPSESTPAALYGLPKVHKVNLQPTDDHLTLPQDTVIKIPLRPINSSMAHRPMNYPNTWLLFGNSCKTTMNTVLRLLKNMRILLTTKRWRRTNRSCLLMLLHFLLPSQ